MIFAECIQPEFPSLPIPLPFPSLPSSPFCALLHSIFFCIYIYIYTLRISRCMKGAGRVLLGILRRENKTLERGLAMRGMSFLLSSCLSHHLPPFHLLSSPPSLPLSPSLLLSPSLSPPLSPSLSFPTLSSLPLPPPSLPPLSPPLSLPLLISLSGGG